MEEINEKDISKSNFSNTGVEENVGEKKRAKKKQLTHHQWAELIGFLKSGHYTQVDLAERYGITTAAISAKRKKLGGVKIGENVNSKTTIEAIDAAATSISMAAGFSLEETGRIISEARRSSLKRTQFLGKVMEGVLSTALKEKKLSQVKDDVKVLLDVQAFFTNELKSVGLCLGLKDGELDSVDDLPVLEIVKMTAEEEEAVKNRSQVEDEFDEYSEEVIEE